MVLNAESKSLAAEAVQRAALALQGIDHVKGSDCLAASVLCVCDLRQ